MDLSHNEIISVVDKAFARSKNLQNLKLDGNKISQISVETFVGLRSAEVISLKSNENGQGLSATTPSGGYRLT